MQTLDRVYEEIKVQAKDLAEKVKDLIHEGNVRRVIIRDERGNTFMEVPLSVATIGAIAAPVVAAVAAVATAVARFTVVVERTDRRIESSPPVHEPGATETQVDMAGTVPQRVDNKGTKIEDSAGTGEHDSQGG